MPIVDCSLSIPDKVLYSMPSYSMRLLLMNAEIRPIVSLTAVTSRRRLLEKAFKIISLKCLQTFFPPF